MRTTVKLEKDVAAAVNRLRRKEGIGLSEAVNRLARTGMLGRPARRPFKQRTVNLGLRVDVTDVADALEALDGPESR